MINGCVLVTRWIVDATGRGAAVARRLGARRVHLDGLVAVGGVGPGPGDDGLTAVAAVADGWWYRAALGGGRSVRLYMMDRDRVAAVRDPAGWAAALSQAPLVGTAPAPASLRVLPAATGLLDPITGPGWIAAGDAACTVDPLSSAGITKALASGQGAAAAILAGDPARHAAAERARFEHLVAGAREMYARERRFASPFWASRRGAVWLDPEAVVGPIRGLVPGLTRPEQDALRRATASARPAAEVVAALCEATALPAWRALTALQRGREREAL